MKFVAKSLPFVRLYNSVVYCVSTAVYLAVVFVLETVSSTSGTHVFIPDSSERSTFMTLAVMSWALCALGSLIILVLYFPCKRRDHPRHPTVNPIILATFSFALFVTLIGIGIAAAAAVFVFIGSRNRNLRVTSAADSTRRTIVLPVLSGILPALFFAFMSLGVATSFLLALSDFRRAGKPSTMVRDNSLDEENPVPSDPPHM
jgi:hypothetical protein